MIVPQFIKDVIDRKPSDIDAPSILEQTKWPVGFYQFPKSPRTEYFNCSIVDWNGADWLITRKRVETGLNVGHNSIWFWRLQNNRPVSGHPIKIYVRFQGEHHEDPRAFVRNGRVFLSYCNFRMVNYGRQCWVEVGNNLATTAPFSVSYGRQGRWLGDKHEGHEKNWIWFFNDEKQLNFIYTMEPMRVVGIRGRALEELPSPPRRSSPLWRYGEVRGGTPLTRIGDEYWSFFHSSTDHPTFRRRYHMGAIVMAAKPPYRVLRISRKPILSGSVHDPRNPGAPLTVFPNGAIHRNNEWLVVLGVNDHTCAWIKIPHCELLNTLAVV